MFLGGVTHFALAAATSLLLLDVKPTSSGLGDGKGWSYFFGFFFFVMPLAALFPCLWSICNFIDGLGKDRWRPFFWYSLQGWQVILLVLLYHLRVYNSSGTVKP